MFNDETRAQCLYDSSEESFDELEMSEAIKRSMQPTKGPISNAGVGVVNKGKASLRQGLVPKANQESIYDDSDDSFNLQMSEAIRRSMQPPKYPKVEVASNSSSRKAVHQDETRSQIYGDSNAFFNLQMSEAIRRSMQSQKVPKEIASSSNNRKAVYQDNAKKTQYEKPARPLSEINLKVKIHDYETTALVDSGATSSFVSQRCVEKAKIPIQRKERPYNVIIGNGIMKTRCSHETKDITLQVQQHYEKCSLDIMTDGDSHDIILGMSWLRKHNPSINWKTQEVTMNGCDCVNAPRPLQRQSWMNK